jgi:effector-binding domain-containing protein
MEYEVKVRSVPARHLAVVRQQCKWSELGGHLIPLLDRVYAKVRAGQIIQSGQNVFLYKNGTKDAVTVEAGVEVAHQFDDVEDVVFSSTPSGEVVSTLHIGPYSNLGAAYDALFQWCDENRRLRANTWWEVYGDWDEDSSKLQTEVFYLLQRQ